MVVRLIFIFFLFAITILLNSCRITEYKKSDHYDGVKFFNPGIEIRHKSREDFKKWKAERKNRVPWPEYVENNSRFSAITSEDTNSIFATLIGHSTIYVQTPDFSFITDPVFSDKVGPMNLIGVKRVLKPAIDYKELPMVDAVLLSHNHFDHMDVKSLRRLRKMFDPVFVVPLGLKPVLRKKGFKKVVEMDWWESANIKGTNITLTPAVHWSKRSLGDNNETLWGGFVVETKGTRIYYGGDTGYGNHFVDIAKRFNSFDFCILPIGAYEPRWFMKSFHMNPEEAVLAHKSLNSKHTIGCHWGTFRLTDEAYNSPCEDLKAACLKHSVSDSTFLCTEFGQTIKLFVK